VVDRTDVGSVEHGGEDKMKLVEFKPDKQVMTICKGWAGDYDSTDADNMGFQNDDKKTGFAAAVGDFKEELQAEGKLV